MKKILRLVTTSVLTLTLVACGEAASSSANTGGTTGTGTVSSAYANVTSVNLSAASDSLTQRLGSLKRVVVNATLNANTNPNIAIEWFVNGTKSNQTGRVFEYAPIESGAFRISARVGSLVSNEIVVNVGANAFVIEKAVFADADTVEITAPGGASVTVLGGTMLPTSFYSISKGVYVIELEEELEQGDKVTVTFKQQGFQDVVREVIYDTRTIEIDDVNFVGADGNESLPFVNGAYEIIRPFKESEPISYNVVLKQKDLDALGVSRVVKTQVPAGATLIADQVALIDISTETITLSFPLTVKSTLGVYKHTITVGGKELELSVRLLDAVRTVALETSKVWLSASQVFETYDFFFQGKGVTAGADGVYEVELPFATMTPNFFSKALVTGTPGRIDVSRLGQATGAFSISSVAKTILTSEFLATDTSAVTPFKWAVAGANTNALAPNWGATGIKIPAEKVTLTASAPGNLVDPDGFVVLPSEGQKIQYYNNTIFYTLNNVLSFNFLAKHFETPAVNTGLTNQFNVAIKGPTLFSQDAQPLFQGFAVLDSTTATGTPQLTYPLQAVNFVTQNGTTENTRVRNVPIEQIIDHSTPAGLYTFTIKAGPLGDEISKEVQVRLVAPKPQLTVNMVSILSTASSVNRFEAFDTSLGTDVYRVEKPFNTTTSKSVTWFVTAKNIESKKAEASMLSDDAVKFTEDKLLFSLNTGRVPNTNILTEYWAENKYFSDTDDGSTRTLGVDFGSGVGATVNTTVRAVTDGSTSDLYEYLDLKVNLSAPTVVSPIDDKISVILAKEKNEFVLINNGVTLTPYTNANAKLDDVRASATSLNNVTTGLITNTTGFVVNSTTVPGTYKYTYELDGMAKTITIEVVQATPKVFVLSDLGLDSLLTGTANNGLSFNEFATGGSFRTVLGALRRPNLMFINLVSGNDNVLTARPVDGEFVFSATSSQLTGTYLFANIGIIDLAKGTYPYEITKKYPNGQVVSISDIISLDVDALQRYTVNSGATQLGNRDKFIANWTIDTRVAAEKQDLEYGTYDYTFKIGNTSVNYKIVIKEAPDLEVEKVVVGKNELSSFLGQFLVQSKASAQELSFYASPVNLPSVVYTSSTAEASLTSKFVNVNNELNSQLEKLELDANGNVIYKLNVIANKSAEVITTAIYLYGLNPLDSRKVVLIGTANLVYRVVVTNASNNWTSAAA